MPLYYNIEQLTVLFTDYKNPQKVLEGDVTRGGHLPSFFVPTPGYLDSLCVPTPGNLPIFFKKMLIPGG